MSNAARSRATGLLHGLVLDAVVVEEGVSGSMPSAPVISAIRGCASVRGRTWFGRRDMEGWKMSATANPRVGREVGRKKIRLAQVVQGPGCGIDPEEPARQVLGTIGAKPFALDEVAAERERALLVLALGVVEPDPASHGLIFLDQLPIEVEPSAADDTQRAEAEAIDVEGAADAKAARLRGIGHVDSLASPVSAFKSRCGLGEKNIVCRLTLCLERNHRRNRTAV